MIRSDGTLKKNMRNLRKPRWSDYEKTISYTIMRCYHCAHY